MPRMINMLQNYSINLELSGKTLKNFAREHLLLRHCAYGMAKKRRCMLKNRFSFVFEYNFYAYICSGDGAQVSYLTDKNHYPFNKTRL